MIKSHPSRLLLLAVMIGTLFAGSQSRAQDIQFASSADFAALNQRLVDLEYQFASSTAVTNNSPFACFSCATDPGITFGAEVALLKPFQSEGESPGFDYSAASRLWIGWTRSDGLGVRTRWFDYTNHNPANAAIFRIEDLHLQVIDLELTDKFQLGHWNGVLSAGLRYADYEEFSDGDAEQMNDSIGPVLGIELRRHATKQISLFLIARDSLQFASQGLDNDDPEENLLFNIAEIQMGAEWTRCRTKGGEWFVRSAFETQYWSGGTIGDGDTEDLGLIGGTIAIGLDR